MMSESPSNRPYFVPEGVDWDSLPESHRTAITTIVQPVYEEYVVSATDALERSAGSSIVSCLVMELIDQFDVGGLLTPNSDAKDAQQERERLFSRLLRTTGVKQKLTDGLMRLRNQRLKIATMDPFTARRVFGVRSGLTDAAESRFSHGENEGHDVATAECDENQTR